MSIQPKRYRVLGCFKTNFDDATLTSDYLSKGETIFQCDTLDEALHQVKVISENNPECTRFEIVRGEWF